MFVLASLQIADLRQLQYRSKIHVCQIFLLKNFSHGVRKDYCLERAS